MQAFIFADYDDDALVRILRKRAGKLKIGLDSETATHAVGKLARARALPNFGNAGVIEGLLLKANQERGRRLKLQLAPKDGDKDMPPESFVKADFDSPDDDPPITCIEDIFVMNNLQGCDAIKQSLKDIESSVKRNKEKGTIGEIVLNYLFVGNPGTGAECPVYG